MIPMTISESLFGGKNLTSFLGKIVEVKIDRPIGYDHGEKGTYSINYGYIPETISGDGEEIDVYLLGTNKPLPIGSLYLSEVIAIIDRHDDNEQKLVAVLGGEDTDYSKEDIESLVAFREKHYDHTIIMEEDIEAY